MSVIFVFIVFILELIVDICPFIDIISASNSFLFVVTV